MKEELLYCHNITKLYFLVTNENINCDVCKKVIELGRSFFIHKSYNRFTPFQKKYYCMNCSKKAHTGDLDTFTMAKLTTIIPENSKLITDHPPETKEGRINLFQAAYLESDITNDRTVHTGRMSLEGAQVGDPKYLEEQKDKNKHLAVDNFEKKILDLKEDE